MRILLLIGFCVAALWLGDVLFFKSRYSHQIWANMNQEALKLSYEVRKWVRF